MPAATPLIASALPRAGGVGLKPEHFRTILETQPAIGFFEIHAENYMVAGGPFHHYLERIRADYPLSIHGVGLSIGGEDPLDEVHLDRLAVLLERYQPDSFSEHLAWSSHNDVFFNDLLPVPYDAGSLACVCAHVDRVQERLGRRMLLENPATYVEFEASTLAEADFISEVVRRTGCGLLLDVNNVHVTCVNHHRNAHAYLCSLPLGAVCEIHLAGHASDIDSAGAPLLIDSHGSPVEEVVWKLYDEAISLVGPQPTLIERDHDLPELPILAAEACQAERIMSRHARKAA
jgi:uncharacterized protein